MASEKRSLTRSQCEPGRTSIGLSRFGCDPPVEPGPGDRPVTLDGPGGELHRIGRFLDGETRKEPKFDDSALPWIEMLQLVERHVERQDVRRVRPAQPRGVGAI